MDKKYDSLNYVRNKYVTVLMAMQKTSVSDISILKPQKQGKSNQ